MHTKMYSSSRFRALERCFLIANNQRDEMIARIPCSYDNGNPWYQYNHYIYISFSFVPHPTKCMQTLIEQHEIQLKPRAVNLFLEIFLVKFVVLYTPRQETINEMLYQEKGWPPCLSTYPPTWADSPHALIVCMTRVFHKARQTYC